jgi:hypothetical protein
MSEARLGEERAEGREGEARASGDEGRGDARAKIRAVLMRRSRGRPRRGLGRGETRRRPRR